MKIVSLFLTFSIVLVTSSCKKEFLDLEPYNQIPLGDIITNEGDMQAAVNGTYAQLRDIDLFGRTVPLLGDLLSDNAYISTVNSNRYLAEFTYSYINTHGNAQNTWNDGYNAILRANNVINANLPATPVSNQLKGEALTLRALMYFTLVNIFAKPYTVDANAEGIPIIVKFDAKLKPARAKVNEVYAQIEKDLNDAFGLMTQTTNSSYITKFVAKALLAKVAMFKGDWNAAKTAALDVVTNGGYTLTSAANLVAYWKNPVPVTNKLETIFEISADNINNNATNALAYFYEQAGYGDALCADDLYNKYSATDARRNLFLSGQRPAGQTVRIVNKYSNTTNAAERDDIKILRYADVLLILSEAYARTNDEPNALTRLNQLAQLRDPSFAGYTSTGATLIEDILTERRKELAFEGHRYWDLTRLNRDVVRVNVNNNYPSNAPLTLAIGSAKRIWPIPQSEKDANTNITQNPGY
jgi:starch-binding outer membrane protein, SusD/RagB family